MESSSLATPPAEGDHCYSLSTGVETTQADIIVPRNKNQTNLSPAPPISQEEIEQSETPTAQGIIQILQSFTGTGSDFYEVYPLSPVGYRIFRELVGSDYALRNRFKYAMIDHGFSNL